MCRPLVRKNQKGQSVMEYVILTGLIGILCMVSVRNFGEAIKNKIEQATKKINSTISIQS